GAWRRTRAARPCWSRARSLRIFCGIPRSRSCCGLRALRLGRSRMIGSCARATNRELSAMLRTGQEHLQSLRDGRAIYVGGERIDDVTRHPAFSQAAETVAAIYDMKAAPETRDTMTYQEDGAHHSIYFLQPRSRDDLQRRM